MKKLTGTKTEKNLMAAFAGESQARNKYTYYAKKAREEKLIEYAGIIQAIADNEMEHAKIWFKHLHEEKIADTETNLQDCINGEHYEWSDMYQAFAKDARAEGFDHIAVLFGHVAEIEKSHEAMFQNMLHKLREKKVFTRDTKIRWVCQKCGHVHFGETPPACCPVCSHGKEYFAESEVATKSS
jgi:rubrerythrin